jgi:hypothetical protein
MQETFATNQEEFSQDAQIFPRPKAELSAEDLRIIAEATDTKPDSVYRANKGYIKSGKLERAIYQWNRIKTDSILQFKQVVAAA